MDTKSFHGRTKGGCSSDSEDVNLVRAIVRRSGSQNDVWGALTVGGQESMKCHCCVPECLTGWSWLTRRTQTQKSSVSHSSASVPHRTVINVRHNQTHRNIYNQLHKQTSPCIHAYPWNLMMYILKETSRLPKSRMNYFFLQKNESHATESWMTRFIFIVL